MMLACCSSLRGTAMGSAWVGGTRAILADPTSAAMARVLPIILREGVIGVS
jgi:hypothetical protein